MSDLDRLYARAREVKMTEKEKYEQRNSFVYGSTKIENDHVTREMVEDTARSLATRERD